MEPEGMVRSGRWCMGSGDAGGEARGTNSGLEEEGKGGDEGGRESIKKK